MRYLNKIIFINSASVKYAEIQLDGNVHFIGTQGVGKSTLLRAILFFYNADKTKLGIPREKKRFDEYYFEYQNSYIIYEIVKDGIAFCVLAFKTNGRVAFRFFDSAYNKDFFIDTEGHVFESWERTRSAFGVEIYYTNIISNYENFRKIIYGDNKGMKSEYRKYALLESKQYQNIPRTIQNVFLNSKLEAQFIKETIIKSLNEEKIEINLSNYSKSHLKDFESEFNDIKIWFEKNKKGHIPVRKQAEAVIANSRGLSFLKKEKKTLAVDLAHRINYADSRKPHLKSELSSEEQSLKAIQQKIENLEKLHKKREQTVISDINLLRSKLNDAEQKQIQYEHQKITELTEKIAQKNNLEQEQSLKSKEKNLLTSKFSEINQKYEALISQLKNQQNEFINQKYSYKNILDSDFTNKRNELFTAYHTLTTKLKDDNYEQITQAQNEINAIQEKTNIEQQKRAGLKHKVFCSKEIEQCGQTKNELQKNITEAQNAITNAKNQIGTSKREWELEEKEIKRQSELAISKETKEKEIFQSKVINIQNKIQQSKTSFYGWLNDNLPEWKLTIGKVIDEGVLFNNNLNPKLLNKKNKSFFGTEIDLNALQNNVKSVKEYHQDIKSLEKKANEISKKISKIHEIQKELLGNLASKFKKKINSLKDNIIQWEYQIEQWEVKVKQNRIQLNVWILKAKKDKETVLKNIEEQLDKLAYQKTNADEGLLKIQNTIKREIVKKEKERNAKIDAQQKIKRNSIKKIEQEIADKKLFTQKRLDELAKEQNDELGSGGADTKRLDEINKRLEEIRVYLSFIKENERTVIEYEKDKRELFDKIPEFKLEKTTLEKKHRSIEKKHQLEKENLHTKQAKQKQKVSDLNKVLVEFQTDLSKFQDFQKSDVYTDIQDIIVNVTDKSEHLKTAVSIISAIKDVHYDSIAKLHSLQKAINLFTGNFNEQNIFSFNTKFNTTQDYLDFATNLKEFIDEDKINQYEKRVNERFAHIIQLIGKETDELISKEAEIEKVIKKINNDFLVKNFVGAIKSMEMRTQSSSNKIVKLLLKIKDFNDENSHTLGSANLFTTSNRDVQNKKAVELLKQLVNELVQYKSNLLTLSESFDLQFKIVENDNDSGWVEKLSNVGSEGTDVLVKAMINILLLNVFKESASKRFKDFKLHCMMDEIGKLHPNNVKGILRFANDRNILLINGSPTSYNATDYRYTYLLSKIQSKANSKKYITKIKRLIKATIKRTS